MLVSSDITIIDYGCNNILSLIRALEYSGATVHIAQTDADIRSANRLILPGVGSFKVAVDALKKRNFHESILEFLQSDRPFLGICVGMQLLFQQSEEFGLSDGLGIIKGTIKKLPTFPGEKLPNINWQSLNYKKNTNIKLPETPSEELYFVHSFAFIDESDDIVATIPYGDKNICAIIQKNNCIGLQYHPEKSGTVGLRHLKYFLNL